MKTQDEIFQRVVREHEGAMRIFKDRYLFKVKQDDILFYLSNSLSRYESEQIADQKKVEALNKKIAKRQPIIDRLTNELEISKSVTELDICNDRK